MKEQKEIVSGIYQIINIRTKRMYIALNQRGESPYVNHIKEHEWPLVMQSFSAICQKEHISPSQIMKRAKMGVH